MDWALLVRHGESTYNRLGLVNGDPSVVVCLDDEGVRQAKELAARLAGVDVDLAVRTRFARTHETLDILLDGRDVPVVDYPELDDVRLGVFESRPVDEYRAWRHTHRPDEPPPGEGESRIDALYRYTTGFQRMLDEDAARILAVMHDVPIRFLANALQGADPLDGPVTAVANASVLRVTTDDLYRGLGVMRDRLGH
ncbi:MAG: histidine phosphatase family protein [Thermoleophilia bacterium]